MGDDGLSIIQKGGSSFVEVTDETELHSNGYITEKDPRKIARNYQLELCKKALEENVIVYLETGCGKTHIAVLLMYEMGYLIKKPQKNICVFLAPTVALVHQQARVISESTDFKVGLYCGEVKLQRRHDDWYKEVEQYEVLVMTPQMLLHSLSHCFIKMEMIVLLIFDECHYAQLESNHPYAEIMKVFYNSKVGKLPRIFGMTASPIFGKGASLDGLKTLLHAKICTVEDKEELEKYVSTPVVKAYPYGSNTKGSPNSYQMYLEGLEEIKRQCISVLGRNSDDHNNTLRIKKLLQRLHYSMIFCLQSLGLCGALQASRFLLNGDQSERNELIEATENASDDNLCNEYLFRAAALFDSFCIRDGSISDLSHTIVLKEPLFSQKVLCLIGILSTFRPRPNMKCIIFVNRIVVARSLSYMIQQLKILASWRCDFLVGVHSGLKSMSRKTTNNVVEQFRSGKLNLLIATKVGEEGLDIQTCCLVIRFDLPETVASFIQSRGRARMPQSEYALLVDSDNEKELNLIDSFKKTSCK
ncbi:hypothetical protein Nepgr_032508 [Nepenthes gracilis]|uniref:Uncharacterized protein n=1 Tax=Nepenthes gracilis TaxID=150966 RepID=A0AAD3TIQ7_NEPGR|nr:hypothetical protein Nepgr_032508 [Nepenthes gracilis]